MITRSCAAVHAHYKDLQVLKANLFKPHPFLFVAIIALLLWPALYYYFTVLGFGGGTQLRFIVDSTEFRMGLNHSEVSDGCIAMQSFEQLDLVIVGNSHAAEAIDHHILAEAFPGIRFGVCAFPMFEIGMFQILLDYFDQRNLHASRILWIADIGNFLEVVKAREKQYQLFRSLLYDGELKGNMRLKWLGSWLRGHPPLLISEAQYYHDLELQRARASELNPKVVDNIIATHEFQDIVRLRSIIKQATVIPDLKEQLHHLCASLKKKSIDLDVAIYPFPDWINQSEEMNLNWSSMLMTGSFIRKNLPCVRFIWNESLPNWGLDARHFLKLSAEFDHRIWLEPEKLTDYFQNKEQAMKKKLLDADHLNALGATIFTQQLILKLSKTVPPARTEARF